MSQRLSRQTRFLVWHFEDCQQLTGKVNARDLIDDIRKVFGFKMHDILDLREGHEGYKISEETQLETLKSDTKLHVINLSKGETWDSKLSQ